MSDANASRTPYALLDDMSVLAQTEEHLLAHGVKPTEEFALGDESDSDGDYLVLGEGRGSQLEPQPATRTSLALLNTAWIGLSCVIVSWGIVLLPSQTRSTVGDDDAGLGLAVIVVIGSLLTLIVTPYIGIISDRTQNRFGRRRPFLVVGVVWLFICQLLLGLANPHKPPEKTIVCVNGTASTATDTFETHGHLGILALVYALATVGYQLIGTPYNGLLADKTPRDMRGFSSGIMGLMSVMGNLLGASAGFLYSSVGVVSIYMILAVILAVTVAVVVFSQREKQFRPPHKLKPLSCQYVMREYVSPFRNSDFCWVFFTRFLMQQGMATVMFFLEFYFHDQVALPHNMRAEEAVSYALLPLLLFAALSSVVAGNLSDRLGGRRRVFVMASAVIMAGSALAMVFTRTLAGCLGVAVIFGIGFGTFIAVDFAMVLDILPSDVDRAKDLAVWHQALVLPQLIATPIGGAIRDEVSRHFCHHPDSSCIARHCSVAYVALFSVTCGYFLLSGLLVRQIKGIK